MYVYVCDFTTVKVLHLYFLSDYVYLNPAILPLNHSPNESGPADGEGESLESN